MGFLVQIELFELCKFPLPEAYIRETIFTTLVLAILFVQRTLSSEALRESLGKFFFIGALIFISTGAPLLILEVQLNFMQEQLYLLESYHRTHIIVLIPLLFFSWIPWAFVYSILRNSQRIPAYVLALSTALAALVSGLDVATKNWLFQVAIPLIGALLIHFKGNEAIFAKERIQPINKEIWILILVIMIILPAAPQKLVLGSCFTIFFIFLEAKPRIFWWLKGSEKIFDWAFFHSFLLSSFFLLYPGITMSTLVVGSMMVCLIVPSIPSRKAPLSLIIIILLVLVISSLLDLSTSNQRIVLWHFLLSLRLLYFYGKRGAWVAISLVFFVLYYTVTRIPSAGVNLDLYQSDEPQLIEFQNLQRVQLNEEILYKKTDFEGLFKAFHSGKSWIFINSLSRTGDSDTVRIFDLERSKQSEKLEPTFYFDDLQGIVPRRKLLHLLRENAPNFISFNFHKVHNSPEYGEWIRILADRLSGGIINFTDDSYPCIAMKRLLLPFFETFPEAKVIFHDSGATFYSGLEPKFNYEGPYRHPVTFSLGQFLHHIERKDSINFLKLKEQLAFLQIDSFLKGQAGIRPDNSKYENLSLFFYHKRMDWVAHRIVKHMREWDSLGQGLIYFQRILEEPDFYAQSSEYSNFLRDVNVIGDGENAFSYRIYKEQIIRGFPDTIVSSPSARIDPQDSNLWYQMVLYLSAKKFKEAHQFMIEKALVPKTSDEKRILRTLWEELELPEAASFYH